MRITIFIIVMGVLVGQVKAAGLQEWPVVFPNKLLNKSPIRFPLKANIDNQDLPGDFVRVVL